jgi:hypothetical protein
MNGHDDMNDTWVLNVARDVLSRMPLGGPPDVGAIMAGGRARRRRRMIPGATATLAVAAGAALAVTALAPASHQASRHSTVQLTGAWTVTQQADGNVTVTVRELTDLAGLQSALRADGVPASVTPLSTPNPACQPYPGGKPIVQQIPGLPAIYARQIYPPLLKHVFPVPYQAMPPGPIVDGTPGPTDSWVEIVPSALPSNAGVWLGVPPNALPPPEAEFVIVWPQLVYASPDCTGTSPAPTTPAPSRTPTTPTPSPTPTTPPASPTPTTPAPSPTPTTPPASPAP